MFSYTGAMSKGDQARFRAQKARTATDLATEEHKRIMGEFESNLAKVRQKYKRLLKEQHGTCSNDYYAIKARADQLYKEAVQAARAERDAKKSLKRNKCKIESDLIKEQRREEAEIVKNSQAEEKRYWKEVQQIKRANKSRDKERTRSTGRERRQESDGEVLNNLEPQFHVVWKKVKHIIKGNDRKSRTEAFVDWVHEHEDTVQEIQVEDAEREVRRFERKNSQPKRKSRSATIDDEPPF